ncbi:hypothetical protein RFF05_07340 [Bengtsoniella intestinalis]|uniref:hypothetical protein n=1 Tax=Bengtsoniella intestinalis TaxID=3073143 RepID=UPI00391EE643
MKRFQLKNIAILVLVLANACLIAVLLHRHYQQTIAQERATQEIITLFATQGVTLAPSFVLWEEPLNSLELEADSNLQHAIAQALLNDEFTVSTATDGSAYYQSPSGTVSFSPDGTLEAYGVLGDDTALAFIQDFCQTYGYDNLMVISDGETTTATATLTYRGTLVTGLSVTFTLVSNRLTSVIGTVLPQTHSSVGAEAQVSCLTALSRFLAARRTTGAVVSTVTDVTACYTFSSTPNAPMSLQPQWIVQTDNGTYYVDAFSAQVQYG